MPALRNNDNTLQVTPSAVYNNFSPKFGLGQTFFYTYFESLGHGLMIRAVLFSCVQARL